MGYKYETHLHTSEGSRCATASGVEQVRSYYEAGYAGIIVTDHFFNGNTTVPQDIPWEERVNLYCLGYEHAKEEGDRIGMDVFFGIESGFQGTDFLIYGLGKDWLLANGDMLEWSVEEQYRHVKADGGWIVHAHPFREAWYINEVRLYPEYIDAVEVINRGNNSIDPTFNNQAYEYALSLGVPMTGGSDVHSVPAVNGGMEFDVRLTSIQDYMDKVMSRKGHVIGIEEVM